MNRILFLILLSLLLISCTPTKIRCLEKVCVESSEAAKVSEKTKKMYRDFGYRVPTYIPPLNYPNDLERRGLEATLVISIDISKDGYVVDSRIKSSTVANLFDHSALAYVNNFRFEPSKTPTKGQLQRVTYQLR